MLSRIARMGRPDPQPDAPTLADFTVMGLDAETAAAALQHPQAERRAGHLYWYRPLGGDFWNVWLEHAVDTRTGYHGVRIELTAWVAMWLLGTLPGGAQ